MNGFLVFCVFMALAIIGVQLYRQSVEDKERSKENEHD